MLEIETKNKFMNLQRVPQNTTHAHNNNIYKLLKKK